MNPYFSRETPSIEPPEWLLGQLTSVEPEERRDVLLVWDAVPLKWAEEVWRESDGEPPIEEEIKRLLDEAPIFHFQMRFHSESELHCLHFLHHFSEAADFGRGVSVGSWFKLQFRPSVNGNASSYSSTSSDPIRGYLTLHQNTQLQLTQHLSGLSPPKVIQANPGDAVLQAVLDAIPTPHMMGVLDVGQGSANVMLNEDTEPLLYFDVGCGMGSNVASKPANLKFCTCGPNGEPPVVLLSHWDKDHFDAANGDERLLACTWITPVAHIVAHQSFQQRILDEGGAVIELLHGFADFQFGASNSFTLIQCNGRITNRNDSGHALIVENAERHWLLPADAAYMRIRYPEDLRFTAVVATHHGARFPGDAPKGAPDYGRLVYSFGPDNKNGAARHPVAHSVGQHIKAYWQHANWTGITSPGALPPSISSNVRATASHSSAAGGPSQHLGSVAVGWVRPPALKSPPHKCPKCGESFNLVQN